MSVFVYSTLSCPQRYVKWAEAVSGNVPREERAVLIQGGANVANKNLITPRGVVTEIKDEEYELLKQNDLFNTHVKNGYVTVEERKADVDKVVTGMEARSPDAPLTPGDFDATPTHEADGTTVKAKKRK
jgi:hypothetical protein